MLPYKLMKDLESTKPLYTYKDVIELVAWALVPPDIRGKVTVEEFVRQYPDVFDQKMIDADFLISYFPPLI